ncbi:DEAD/DEAH box helicase [Streptomyces sp. P1-3]|uniref:DEAD/DEAH box helicase n=1 Tax=Streptomyces sp. P1-3 TaxID=3421658 RepID=UPI003D35CA87
MADPVNFEARLAGFRSARYASLRPSQARVLEGYVRNIDKDDVAVELPTGFGKTLVALLIADFALERGQRVAYLTGTNQLAEQVLAQAGGLPGLEAVKFSSMNYPPADLAAYHDARVLGVMNYWTYFNTSPKVEPADVLVFDDAHMAEQPLAGLFAIRIDRRTQRELYERLCDLVLAHTGLYPSISLMREGLADSAVPPELIAFPHWAAISDRAAHLLSSGLPPNDAKFLWLRVRPNLHACGVLIGPSAVEIRPYNPPTQTLPGYRHSKQRLYLSATLGTMDDLQRRLGIAPVVNVLDEPVAEDHVGRRLFLLAPGESADQGLGFALRARNTILL